MKKPDENFIMLPTVDFCFKELMMNPKVRTGFIAALLDFSWFDDDLYYHTIHLYDDGTKERYSDLLELQFLELKKLPPEAQSEKGILRWMRFLHDKNRKEFEHMAGTDEYIQEAYDTLVQMSADEKKQMEYEAREKALRDYQSQMKSAENAGFKKGEQTGFQKGEQAGVEKAKRIFQLNAQGKTITEIAKICQITESEVKDILD